MLIVGDSTGVGVGAQAAQSLAAVPPFSSLLSRRSIRACEVFRQGAERFGVRFIDFCEPREKACFTADPSRFIAADQVHPTAEGYRHCYRVLRKALPER